MTIDVAGIGTVVVDHQIFLEKYPEWDTKTELQKHRMQVGGPVPTALTFLARLGKKCAFVGKWGDDTFGSVMENDLQKEGIVLDHSIRVKNESSGIASVWVEAATGRRTIACSRGSFSTISSSEIDITLFAKCKALHLDGWSSQAGMNAAKEVKRHGGHVFLDAGSPKSGLKELIPLVDVMVCPQQFAGQFFGRDDNDFAAEELLRMGVGAVVFTAGENGTVLYREGYRIRQRAFNISAIDTTGAGDVFCGALIYALGEKMSYQDALAFSAAAAALKCTKVGNRSALPQIQEIESLLSS